MRSEEPPTMKPVELCAKWVKAPKRSKDIQPYLPDMLKALFEENAADIIRGVCENLL